MAVSNFCRTFASELRNKVVINHLKVIYKVMAKKNDFIKQLAKLKKEFMQYAEENSAKVDKDTFEVEMCNFYLSFRLEAEDEDGDTIVFSQEIETDSTNDIYQKPIYGNMIHISR